MKYLIGLTFSFLSFSAFANSYMLKKDAVIRTEKYKADIQKVLLKDLVTRTAYEGKYFKVVHGKSDEAISTKDTDHDLQLRAATVYYHLTKARDFFVNSLNSQYVKSLPQLVIRIDIKNGFSELGHFAHDNRKPEFNNALTIPAGTGLSGRGIKPWNTEIWFRPGKKINISELNFPDQTQSYIGLLKAFRGQVHNLTFQRYLADLLREIFLDGPELTIESSFRTAGASLLAELAYRGTPFLQEVFQQKWYFLETALVPEIIYHEYAHVALSDHLELSHSTPVIEGMADFFAGKIADNHKLAAKIKKYNSFSSKDGENDRRYELAYETKTYANTDFVFGLLWSIEDIIGEKTTVPLVYSMRERIETNSSIATDLQKAILDECRTQCSSPNIHRYKLLEHFYDKGI